MFDIKMVTTDKSNRRSGLGTDLLRRSVQLASSLGYKVSITFSSSSLSLSIQAIKTEATGQYSRKAFERLDFKAVSEVLYSEYEVNGEKIFEPIKNHRGTTFMIKCNNEVKLVKIEIRMHPFFFRSKSLKRCKFEKRSDSIMSSSIHYCLSLSIGMQILGSS